MISNKTLMLLDGFLLNHDAISQEERKEIIEKVNLQIADYLNGEVVKAEKLTGVNILLHITVEKPLTKIKEITDDEQKQLLDMFRCIHLGEIQLFQEKE